MQSRPLLLFACCSFAGAAVAQEEEGASSPGLAFHSLQFFGHADPKGADAPPAAGEGEGRAGVKFSRQFDRSGAAFIAAQAVFKNLRVDDNEFDYKLIVGLYTFEGQLVSAAEKRLTVPPDWNYTWASQSFGWPEPGKWDVGTYRVKVWLEGAKVAEAAFYVRDDEAVIDPGVGELDIKSLSLFEGGDAFTPGITKRPATSFARSRARRIYWVVRADNRLHRTRAQRPNIVAYYYRPDGTLMAASPSRATIAPEVADVTLMEGVGWSEPGHWEPGRYRFELELDNRVIAERHFTISDPKTKPRTRPAVVHFGLLDAGVYSADGVADAPAGARRQYATRFEGEGLETLLSLIHI